MFRRIAAKDYRCLRDVDQTLNQFEVLVGANASGKSSFLDVVGFLSDFVSENIQHAVKLRSENFHDLVWGRKGTSFQLTVDTELSEGYEVRYRLDVAMDPRKETFFANETAWQYPIGGSANGVASLVERGRRRSALDQYHETSNAFYENAVLLGQLLAEGIRTIALDARELRKPSPPSTAEVNQITGLMTARMVLSLRSDHPQLFGAWLDHVRTAFPDIQTIDSVLREEDSTRYLVVEYKNSVRVPSWALSEGTLRLIALTILAYDPSFHGVYLIEEPENGVHPTALETIFQSLSSMPWAQVLVATHSPLLLSMAEPEQLLFFSKTPDGTKVTRGSEHPRLQDWKREVSLGELAASGLLG